MPTYHRDIAASERHPVPRYGFSSLGAAEAHVYTVADESCFVRVGSSAPYTHYLITEVDAGVATLVEVGGALAFGAPSALVVGGSNVTGASGNVADAEHLHALPPFGTGAGQIAEGNHTHTGLGSSYVDMWDARLPAATPHAADDMMDGGVIDPKWTLHDPSGCVDVVNATTYPRRYLVSKLNTANGIGLRQSVSGFESMSMVVRVSVPEACYAAGLAIGFGTAASSDYRIVGIGGSDTVPEIRTALVSGTGAADGVSAAVSRANMIGPWLRMRAIFAINNTQIWSDCSADGEHWVPILGASAVVLTTAVWFGVAIHGPNTSHSTALFSNFQVTTAMGTSAAAWDALLPGRTSRVAVP